jgi:hypothetical protein
VKKTRQNKKESLGSDSIGTEMALVQNDNTKALHRDVKRLSA